MADYMKDKANKTQRTMMKIAAAVSLVGALIMYE